MGAPMPFEVPILLAGAALNVPAYELAIQVNAQTQVVYVCDLIAPMYEDMRLPIKGFQSRYEGTDGVPWLAVYAPGGTSLTNELAGRLASTTWLVVSRGYRYADGSASSFAEIVRARIQSCRTQEGRENATVTLSGYGEATTPRPRDVRMVGHQTTETDDFEGTARFRCSAETVVAPGDYLAYRTGSGEVWLRVVSAVYTVGTDLAYVDISVEQA